MWKVISTVIFLIPSWLSFLGLRWSGFFSEGFHGFSSAGLWEVSMLNFGFAFFLFFVNMVHLGFFYSDDPPSVERMRSFPGGFFTLPAVIFGPLALILAGILKLIGK